MFDLNKAVEQEVFEYCLTHLREQGHRSMLEDGSNCAYHGVDGAKCAVGCFIPDELYDPEMEQLRVGHLLFRHKDRLNPIAQGIDTHLQLLRELQYFHDDPQTWKNFELYARNFANTMNLNYVEIDNTQTEKKI